MVTGPLTALDGIWKAYGVSISVAGKTGLEAHNDVMDFIDPQGDLRYRATPFADESTTGTFSLPPANIARWAQGIATYAGTDRRPVTDLPRRTEEGADLAAAPRPDDRGGGASWCS